MSLAKSICLALGCVVLTASPCLAANPKPQDYRGWIDSDLLKVNGDDVHQQEHAVEMLSITIVDPAVRQKVLDALEPHLNSPDQDLRYHSIRAYGHWATREQIKQLQQVVSSADADQPHGWGDMCWAMAIREMISLDPDAAKAAMEQRMGNTYTRSELILQLPRITLDNDPTQPAAFALFKELDPGNPLVQTSTLDAITLVRSDSAVDRTNGANVLAHAVVVADERSLVMEALRPHITTADHPAVPFIQAFSHWANGADISTLKKIVATDPSKDDVQAGAQDCWAAAVMGLARIDPQQAATAAKSRANDTFFRFRLNYLLEPIAQGNSTDSSVACWLLGRFDPPFTQPLFPPGFNPIAQKSPEVSGRTE